MTTPTTHTRSRVASIVAPHVEAQAGAGLRSKSAAAAPPPAPAKATPMRAGDLAGKLNADLARKSAADLARTEDRSDRDVRIAKKALASAQGDVTDSAIKIEANLLKAKSVGVDATQKSFWTKVLGAAVAALALSVVISLTVATGGAPLAAAVAVAGVIFAVSIADACCAHMNRRNAQAHAAGCETPPYRLPMGDSSIANLIYMACSGHMKHGTAKNMARHIDNCLRIGMMLVGGLCTGGASIAVNSFEQIAPMVAGAVNVLTMLVNLKSTWGSQATYAKHVKDITLAYKSLREKAEKLLPPDPETSRVQLSDGERLARIEQHKEMLKLINDSERDALPEIDSMRGAVPKRGRAVFHSTLGLSVIITGMVAALMPGSSFAVFRLPNGPQAFVAPNTGGVGGVGTTKARPATNEAPQDAGPAKEQASQDDVRSIEAVRVHLQLKINAGHANDLVYADMMHAARSIITELHDDVNLIGKDYLHDVLRKAINQLEVPEGEAHRLKEAIPGDELVKPVAQKTATPQGATDAMAQDAAAPPPSREMLVDQLTADFTQDLDTATNTPDMLLKKLLARADGMLAKMPENAKPEDTRARSVEQRDLAVDTLGKLLSNRKIHELQAKNILAGMDYGNLLAIASRAKTDISNIALICVMLDKWRANADWTTDAATVQGIRQAG